MSGYRLLFGYFSIGIADDDSSESLLQVVDIACQTQNCHDLGRNSDIVSVLTRHTVGSAAKSVHNISKLAVVHVHAASPGDLSRVDVQLVALEDVVVDHSRKQVVRCSDRMEVAGEMQV